ncbi:hypothetical protein VMCG_01436 [Cytospora schulzeri]|uniref:Sodium/calcium exchanger membrane region domain-containing protein n=1 Tax=Cytospora schulzeri TaxID=448051 RepID=A0A423X6L5_9PEZI|nr:hypothetical protein VMCG_01436 [Valsa malicola]
MARIKNGRARFSSRPLYATVFLMTLLATYALFMKEWKPDSTVQRTIFARDGDEVCGDVHLAKDQCAFVRANCLDDEPGLISYLTFYYCTLGSAKPVAFILLTLWLGLLFSTIGIAASDFFSVNLSTIASVLGLPESLAGVTFLAFGNGSPDVFSTFAAMNSNSGSMAIGELIGAAGFITAVVAGSMALVREFKVSRKSFVRDIVFFIFSVSFTMVFLTDGRMHLWECCFMIAFYVFYVCFVVGVGQRRGSGDLPDISALESGPRIDIDGSSQDDEDEEQKRHIASEMTSSMRVNRPRGRRSHTSTITPIRPSLVGALEFRSVLSSLQRSRNMRMAPLSRGYSDYNPQIRVLSRSSTDLSAFEPYTDDPSTTRQSFSRDRALSSGDAPRNLYNDTMQQPPNSDANLSRDESRQHPGATVQERLGWREKSIWDKAFSLFSLPTVFLLVITLPVVEAEANSEESESDDAMPPVHIFGELGMNAPAVAIENHASIEPETEWQEYRRRARSTRSRSSSASPLLLSAGAAPSIDYQQGFPDLLPPSSYPQVGQQPSEFGAASEHTNDDELSWNRWLLALQTFTGPLFTVTIIWAKYMDEPAKVLVEMILYSLLASSITLAVLLFSTSPTTKPQYHFLFCFLGFIIAIAWISTIAEEVVGVLKAVGVILGMSEAILGLTIFAVGNSVGDLVADITVARLGYPVMALSACFGGPMLNILLGIGLGGTYMSIKGAKHHHKKHPDQPMHYKPYHIEVSGTLFISAITVLVTLVTLLILVPTNKWMMTRKIGLTLITLWSVSTVINVVVEVTGIWKAVA